jgi:hypothetical protein
MSEDTNWIFFNHEVKVPLNAPREQVEQLKAVALEEIKRRFKEESGLSFDQYGTFDFGSTMGLFHYAVRQTGAPPLWKRPIERQEKRPSEPT